MLLVPILCVFSYIDGLATMKYIVHNWIGSDLFAQGQAEIADSQQHEAETVLRGAYYLLNLITYLVYRVTPNIKCVQKLVNNCFLLSRNASWNWTNITNIKL